MATTQRTRIRALPLDLSGIEAAPTRYADHFALQRTGSDAPFILCISEIKHPIVVGTQSAVREAIANRDRVAVDCIARVAISPEKLAELVKVLSGALKKHGSDDASDTAD